MIYTVTCNPAIDRTIYIDRLHKKDVTRTTEIFRTPAGKGINVSNVCHTLLTNTVPLGFIGGPNGAYIEQSLQSKGIKTDFIHVQGDTRENIKIVEKDTGQVYEINAPGPKIYTDIVARLKVQLEALTEDDYLILSGSIPSSVEQDLYKDIIKRVTKPTVIVDASGEVLQHAIDATPDIIKPNVYELEQYTGKKLKTKEDIIKAAESIVKQGVKKVYISMGDQGAILVMKDKVFEADTPLLEVKSTVGAGDSFIAGMVFAMELGYPEEDILLTATSVGAASCLSVGTAEVDLETVHEIRAQITIKEIK